MLSPGIILKYYLLLLGWIPLSLSAQFSNIRFKHLTTANGLSDKELYCIFQDSKGFIWFGAKEGLSRYDGIEMTNWFHQEKDSNSLSENSVFSIAEDKNGNIWVGTRNGLNVFRKETGKIHPYLSQLEKAGGFPQCNTVFSLACSPNGVLWIGTLGGLFRYYPEKDSFALVLQRKVKDVPQWPAAFHRNCLDFDKSGNLYAFMGNKIYVTRNEGRSFDSLKLIEHGKSDMLPAFIKIIDGNLFYAYQDLSDLYVLNFQNGVNKTIRICESDFSHFPPPIRIMHAERVNENEIWVATAGDDNDKDYGGIVVLDNSYSVKYKLISDQNDQNTINIPWVLQVLKDRQGTIWLATIESADYYHPVFGNFRIYNKQAKNTKDIYATPAICRDKDDNIWMGSWDQGIARLDKISGEVHKYRIPEKLAKGNSLNRINWIAADKQDILWVLTDGGMLQYNIKKEEFITIPGSNEIMNFGKQFFKVISLNDNQVLFLGKDTVWQYDYSNKKFYRVYPQKEITNNTSGIYSIFPDIVNGRFWIFSKQPNRIVLIDLIHKKETVFENPAIAVGVNGLLMLGDSVICVATESDGFYYYQVKEKKTSYFRIQEGLCSNQIKAICPGQHGTIWLGTFGGIAHFNTGNKTFRNYSIQDGLVSEAVLHNSCQTKDGKIFFPTTRDIVCIDPAQIREHPPILPPAITRLKVAEKERYLQDGSKPIHLKAQQNSFSVEFSSMNFINPSGDEFQYLLEGYDKDWINAGNRKYANYTNLPGGNYILRIRNRNGTRPWSEATQLHFSVATIFYKTWWFISLMVLFTAGLLFAFYRMRLNRLLAIEKMRQRFSRDLHDDIGSTLSSINILSKTSINHQKGDSNPENVILEKIQQRSQKMLDAMDDIIWSTKPENDSVEDLAIRMNEYASETLEAAGIHYSLHCPVSLEKIKLNMEQKKNLFLIFKEAVNNLAKYSESRNAYISFTQKSSFLSLTVKDEGKGFPEKLRSGNGLQNMNNRAGEINARIEIDSTPGRGTTIRVDLPV